MDISDQNLIKEIRAGSQLAFNLLMQRYEKQVYRVAYQHTRAMDSALDVTQTVFLKVYTKLDTYSAKGAFKSWLMRIAHNQSLDWIRSNSRLREQEELNEEHMPESGATADEAIQQREFKQIVEQMLPKLNDKQRIAVSLRFFEDMTFREIARILGCSEANARNILFRSMEKLRSQWVIKQRVNYEQL